MVVCCFWMLIWINDTSSAKDASNEMASIPVKFNEKWPKNPMEPYPPKTQWNLKFPTKKTSETSNFKKNQWNLKFPTTKKNQWNLNFPTTKNQWNLKLQQKKPMKSQIPSEKTQWNLKFTKKNSFEISKFLNKKLNFFSLTI